MVNQLRRMADNAKSINPQLRRWQEANPGFTNEQLAREAERVFHRAGWTMITYSAIMETIKDREPDQIVDFNV